MSRLAIPGAHCRRLANPVPAAYTVTRLPTTARRLP